MSSVRNLAVALCVLAPYLPTTATQPAKPADPKPWATSWDAFAKAIAPGLAQGTGSDVFGQFIGQSVTWEGTVSKATNYDRLSLGMFVMEMSRQTFEVVLKDANAAGAAEVIAINIRPKNGSLDAWKQVSPGTRVAFRGVFSAGSISSFGGRMGVQIAIEDVEPMTVLAVGGSLPAIVLASQQPALDRKTVKGWQGAEWEMTTDQVAAVVGKPLGQPVKSAYDLALRRQLQLDPDPEVQCHDVDNIPVGDRTAKARFCFDGGVYDGLFLVDLTLKTETAYASVLDELTARYGAPTGGGTVTMGGSKMERSIWRLPFTEIQGGSGVRGTSLLTVTYLKRRPPAPPSPITVTSPVAGAAVKVGFPNKLTVTGRAAAGQMVFVSTAISGTGKLAPWSFTMAADPDASGQFTLELFGVAAETPATFSLVVYHIYDDKKTDLVLVPLRRLNR